MLSVSVLITCYNLEKYIASAVKSVLGQQCSYSLEVIVVDDSSTDDCVKILSDFEEVTIVHTESNSGVLLATILGLRRCTGDVIFFLDGDDLWHSSKINFCMEKFESDKNLCLVTHDVNFISSSGDLISNKSRSAEVLSIDPDPNKRVQYGILAQEDYVWLGSAFGVHKVNGRILDFCDWAESLPCARKTYQDWPLAYWISSLQDAHCAYVDKTLMSYRIHGANYSGGGSSVPKLISNLEKALNTTEAIEWISKDRALDLRLQWIARSKSKLCLYLLLLYQGSTLASMGQFLSIQLFLFFSPKLFAKEWLRMLMSLFIGTKLSTGFFNRLSLFLRRTR